MEGLIAESFLFTRSTVSRAQLPTSASRVEYKDLQEPGLYLHVTTTGLRTFFLYRKHQRKPLRIKIGRFDDITVAQARTRAKELKAQLALGQYQPVSTKSNSSKSELTLEKLAESYFKTRDLKPATLRSYQAGLNYVKDWKEKEPRFITKSRVIERHRLIAENSGRATADSTMRTLRTLLSFYQEQHDSDFKNPVKTLSANRLWMTGTKDRRTRHISQEKLHSFSQSLQQLQHEVWKDYIFFVLASGLRKEEAAQLSWDTVVFSEKKFYIPNERTKNGEQLWLPMNSISEKIFTRRQTFESQWVFPSVLDSSKPLYPEAIWRNLKRNFKIEFSTHDLRRSFSTIAESLDISPLTIKRLINHKSGNDVTEGYIIANVERLREPSERIAQFILKACRTLEATHVEPASSRYEK